jgi:hypothetical protein
MQSIPPGGGGDINALMTGLERALDLMPIKERPELLSQLERLKALIWLRQMRIPASKIREPPHLIGSSKSARMPSVWALAQTTSTIMPSEAWSHERLCLPNAGPSNGVLRSP